MLFNVKMKNTKFKRKNSSIQLILYRKEKKCFVKEKKVLLCKSSSLEIVAFETIFNRFTKKCNKEGGLVTKFKEYVTNITNY